MNTKEVINDCLKNIKPKTVLDLGIGKGRCSKRFFKKDARVIGIDIIKKDLPKKIEFIKSSIKDFDFKENYDLIIASLVLHFLKKEDSFEIIKKMKNSTNKEGHIFIIAMTPKDNLFKDNQSKFYILEDELKELFFDWKTIQIGTYETGLESHGNSPHHNHNLCFILAKNHKT